MNKKRCAESNRLGKNIAKLWPAKQKPAIFYTKNTLGKNMWFINMDALIAFTWMHWDYTHINETYVLMDLLVNGA